jgi:hypothetical protein
MSIWPSIVQLRVEPRALRAYNDAVGDSPHGAMPTLAPDRLAELERRLRTTRDPSKEILVGRELRALGALVDQSTRSPQDTTWRRTLRDVLLANIHQLPAAVVADALAARWSERTLDAALLQRAATCRNPTLWLQLLVERRAAASDIIGPLARAIALGDGTLGDLTSSWKVPRHSPLHIELGNAMLQVWTLQQRSARWPQHKTFIANPHEPADLQRAILRTRFLDLDGPSYKGDLRKGTPIGEWLECAHAFCKGWPSERPQEWGKFHPKASELARIYITTIAIEKFFNRAYGNQGRKQFWQKRVAQIEYFDVFANERAFVMRIGPRYLVEFLDTGNACYSYSESQFQRVRSKSTLTVKDLKLPEVRGTVHWLNHTLSWEREFDDYLEKFCGAHRP